MLWLRTGWAIGPAPLIRSMQLTNQFIPFCVASPLQVGVVPKVGEQLVFFLYVSFVCSLPSLQEALARAWEAARKNHFFQRQNDGMWVGRRTCLGDDQLMNCWFASMMINSWIAVPCTATAFAAKREKTVAFLEENGLKPTIPQVSLADCGRKFRAFGLSFIFKETSSPNLPLSGFVLCFGGYQ